MQSVPILRSQEAPCSSQSTAATQDEDLTPRSLNTLDADLAKFLREGGGNVKKAKLYRNVIAPRFFDIPLDQVYKF